jgi:hypothetical protein
LFTAGLLLAASILASRSDTVSRQAIDREIRGLVRIHRVVGPDGHDSVGVVAFTTDSVPSGSLLAPFLRAHGRIVWYLATHTRGGEARLLGEHDDPGAVRDSVVSALAESVGFNDRLFGMLSKYWRPSGRVIEGYVPTTGTLGVSATLLNRVGARFFYPDRMSATGDTLFTHICAGINGIGDLPEPVDPLVEAFAFVAVNSVVFKPNAPLMHAFDLASKRAKATSASKDPATRVLRAQGALWSQLEQSPAMASAMASAYAKQERALPFHISSTAP